MMSVGIRNLEKTYAAKVPVTAVNNFDLSIDEGELVVLLGPSGCGKTTLLRCLAGLERPDNGRIEMGGKVVFDAAEHVEVASHKRDIGMVFQNYALFPHMTAGENVAYPLRCRGAGKEEQRAKVKEALTLVECEAFAQRRPAALSGGQQQRVALARALVASPRLILFDEPLSNLDFRLRAQVRHQLRALHRRLGFTAVYVTHDQTEALQLGTRVAVMRGGRLEQLADPQTLFTWPASPYVARFLGISNCLRLHRSGDTWTVGSLHSPLVWRGVHLDDVEYDLFVRSSDIRLTAPGAGGFDSSEEQVRVTDCSVVDVLFSGEGSEWIVQVGNLQVQVAAAARQWPFRAGDKVDLSFRLSAALLYSTRGDSRLINTTESGVGLRAAQVNALD
jgi:iron(III) transport system ATP-binding protein